MAAVAPTSISSLPSTPRAALSASSELSNIEAFIASATPVFVARESLDGSSGYALSDLFAAFEEPSAFGIEVPLRLSPSQIVSQYYVPFLSGMQLYERESAVEGEENVPRRRERLAFEYFETSSPYSRPSFAETVEMIFEERPDLARVRSDALAPSSWVSVSWYPIYRIPQGTMLHDVQGSFLTFHALYDGALRDGDVACPLPPAMSDAQERLIEQKMEKAAASASASASEARALKPFGLSVYKMQGDVWAANERVTTMMETLMDQAFGWLRFRKIIHADYEFFAHFG